MLIALASLSVAMTKCVPLSSMAFVALSPGIGRAAALPMLMLLRGTDQYFCAGQGTSSQKSTVAVATSSTGIACWLIAQRDRLVLIHMAVAA